MQKTYAVIMAGGVGARFWPASRSRTPKQLLDLTGEGQTMIASTVERLQPDIPPERVIVVTGEITAQAVAEAVPALPARNILAEPVGRNTAPCIGWAALHVKLRDPEGVLAVLPSDHLIADKEGFTQAMRRAVAAARQGSLVTFGVTPSRPETGFGYIQMGQEVQSGVRQVVRFVEKPDLETAKRYLAAGNFSWNSGMFFFTQERILAEIEKQMPELSSGLQAIEAAIAAGREPEEVSQRYPTLPAKSVDYGIMEGAEEILCVPVDFGWSDLGSWAAAYELSDKDENGNVSDAETVVVDATGCLVRAPTGKLVALVGVEDLVVVDAGDSLLICQRDCAQDVKQVVDELKARSRKDLV